MVASGSRTMIAGSLSGCIAGFRRSCRFSRLSGPRRWCVGIGLAFAAIGGGDRAHWEGDRRSKRSSVLDDLKRRAAFSKEDRGLLRDWMAIAAAYRKTFRG